MTQISFYRIDMGRSDSFSVYSIHDKDKLISVHTSYKEALEYLANLDLPLTGDRGDVRYSRHCAKILLKEIEE